MGNIDKATGYHSKFSNGYAEDPDSPLIALSTQKIDGKEEKNISDRYEKLNLLYLVHLFIPIKDTGILPLLKGIL